MYKLYKIKNNTDSIRILEKDGERIGTIGTAADYVKKDLLEEYDKNSLDKWLVIKQKGEVIEEYNSKDEIKQKYEIGNRNRCPVDTLHCMECGEEVSADSTGWCAECFKKLNIGGTN